MVNYFTLVHAAQTATPPPALAAPDEPATAAAAAEGGKAAASSPASQGASLLSGVVGEKEAERAASRRAVEAWRRKLLREMLRSELGFNIVVKDSGLPGGAGLGLFVEGSAPEGAVVAVYPVRRPFDLEHGLIFSKKRRAEQLKSDAIYSGGNLNLG